MPKEANLSRSAIDLLQRLVTDAEGRLGRNGAEEIKKHPWFAGFDWTNVRRMRAPFQPNVTSDISN